MLKISARQIIASFIALLIVGCSSAPVATDNRADEQRYNADKAQKELTRETSRSD